MAKKVISKLPKEVWVVFRAGEIQFSGASEEDLADFVSDDGEQMEYMVGHYTLEATGKVELRFKPD